MCSRRVRVGTLVAIRLVCGGFAQALGPTPIPIFLSDNHAGSFGWMARTFPLDEPHFLLLIDAHSDASSVNHSDAVRLGLRRVRDREARAKRVEEWLRSGRIQAFNWIEPLMPQPINGVLWVAGAKLDAQALEAHQIEAAGQVDSRVEFEAREAGALGERWRVADLDGFSVWEPPDLPLLVSIDLDFFHAMPEAEAERAFATIWEKIMSLPRLAGISFAVSRPWLADDSEADQLVAMALNAAGEIENAEIEIATSEANAPDDSLKAAEFLEKNQEIPRYDWNHPGSKVQSRQGKTLRLVVDHAVESADGIWRVDAANSVVVRVASASQGRTRWWQLEPGSATFDLLPLTGMGKDFSPHGTGRAVWQRRRFLGESGDGAWSLKIPDGPQAWGRLRVEAEVETSEGWQRATLREIRVQTGSGFRRALSGQFRAPYVFGIGLAHKDGRSGPETGMGFDCANFLIAAWRETGRWLPWSDPGGLRQRLTTVAERVAVNDTVVLPPDAADKGLIIDFGAHVAALWEDREPFGVLDQNDLLAHHLGGFPELKTLGELASSRGIFAVRMLSPKSAASIWFGGDVVLEKAAPDLTILTQAKGAPIAVNLEGVAVENASTLPGGRYRFVFPSTHLQMLAQAGVTVISLANNHAGDAGADGFRECVAAAKAFGIGVAGTRDFHAPMLSTEPPIALLAASLFSSKETDDLMVTLPRDADALAEKMRELRDQKIAVVMMLHGGDEYSEAVNYDQQHWARWSVDHGAALVLFAHPHVVQPLDSYRGRPVAFSLGNLIYPNALQGADSGILLRADFDEHGTVVEIKTIPVP